MKKVIEVDSKTEGFESLLGENVILLCMNYFYSGKLAGVNESFVLLEEAKVVYETGPWNQVGLKDAQELPGKWRVQVSAIESYGPCC